jgi:AcrR family transcriptional regulator
MGTASPAAIIDAALDIAAEQGWARITLADVAARANIPLVALFEQFTSTAGILRAYLRRLDEAMLRADELGPEMTTRDALFDIVMRRFEAMTPRKEAIRAIMRDSAADPAVGFCAGLRLLRTCRLMLEAAAVPTSGLRGTLRVQGMTAVYLCTFRAWLRDETEDLSETMAALDKALRRAEGFASMTIGRRRRPASGPASEAAG